MSSVYSYTAYGLGVRSELRLPELQPADLSRDVEIRLGAIPGLREESAGRRYHSRITSRRASLYWQDVGAFDILDGSSVTIDPAPGVEENGLRLLLLGSVFGVLLHQRGNLLLHGSAVEIEGSAVAFLGHSGWGKSTLAAALQAEGFRVIADDISAIELIDGRATVMPGYPQIKLRHDSAEALGYDPERLHALHRGVDKRGLRCPEKFVERDLTLRHVYILGDGEKPTIEDIQPNETLIELVRHSYAASILKATGCESEHLLRCGELAKRVTVRRLRKGATLSDIPELIRLVHDDVRNTIAA